MNDFDCWECGLPAPHGFCDRKHPNFSMVRARRNGNVLAVGPRRPAAKVPTLTPNHCPFCHKRLLLSDEDYSRRQSKAVATGLVFCNVHCAAGYFTARRRENRSGRG